MKIILMLVVVFFSGALFASAVNCESDKNFPEITKAELKKQIKNKSVFIVDVNGTKSYAQKHIDTAVDFETVKDQLESHLPEEKKSLLVAYCGGPSCVAWKKAAVAACQLGYTNIKHFKEGIRGW